MSRLYLERTTRILQALSDARTPQSLDRLVRATGLQRAVLSKLLPQLESERWVISDGLSYGIGPRMVRMGVSAIGIDTLPERADAEMRKLLDLSEMTVSLGVDTGTTSTVIKRLGPLNGSAMLPRIGSSMLLHLSCPGRALLAARSDAEIDDYLAQVAGPEERATLRDLLACDIERARRSGYLEGTMQYGQDVSALSAVVRDATARPVAALTLWRQGVFCKSERFDNCARLLLSGAEKLSAQLGFAP